MLSNLNRRDCLTSGFASVAATVLGLAAISRDVQAQAILSRIFVGFPVGGTADGIARALVSTMGRMYSQTILVESKPGAGGQIAADAVRQSAGDGLNLLLTPCSVLTLTPLLYGKPMFEGVKDFSPLLSLCEHAFGLAVPESSPYKTVAEFINGSTHKTISYATPGAGSVPHLLGVIFSQLTGARLNHIPYRGVAPGIQDLIGGQVDATFNPLPSLIEHNKSARLRILAVTSPKRIPTLDKVPTFTELGYGSLEVIERYGLFASAHTAVTLVERLQAKVLDAMHSKDVLHMAKNLEIDVKTDINLKQLQENDRAHWKRLVKSTGITLDS